MEIVMSNRRKEIEDLYRQFDEQRRAFITVCVVVGIIVVLMIVFGAVVSPVAAIVGIALAILWIGSLGRELYRKSTLLTQALQQYQRLEHISQMERALGYDPLARLPWEDSAQLEV